MTKLGIANESSRGIFHETKDSRNVFCARPLPSHSLAALPSFHHTNTNMAGTAGHPIDLTWHVMDLIDLAEMADQAWRRGSWLIMLRARAEKPPVDGGGDDAETSPTKRQSTGSGGGGSSGDGHDTDLAALVEALVELDVEGVFRNVVTFL